jgi:hypothetical protein
LKLRSVLTALFVRPDLLPAARIGRSNPWADALDQERSAPFTNFGLKSPFGKGELDPLFFVEAGDRPLGFSRVFETERLALNWFVRLVERRDVYGYWRQDLPVGPFGKPEEYKLADQAVQAITIHSCRAFTARGAAESALSSLKKHFDAPALSWNRSPQGDEVLANIKSFLSKIT